MRLNLLSLLIAVAASLFIGAISSPSASASLAVSIAPTLEPGKGAVDVSSIPPNALVWFEYSGRQVWAGSTPIRLVFDPGIARITVYSKGYTNITREIEVLQGYTQYMVVELMPTPTPTPSPSPKPSPTSYDYACEFKELKDRVRCRLGLPEDGKIAVVPYLPEECRELSNKTLGACITQHTSLAICNLERNPEKREACAKREIGINNIAQEKAACETKKRIDSSKCLIDLRNKAYKLIKFRFFNLEQSARRLGALGVSEELVVEFISLIERKTQEFTDASNFQQRKRVVWDVKKAWGDFKRDATDELNRKAGQGAK